MRFDLSYEKGVRFKQRGTRAIITGTALELDFVTGKKQGRFRLCYKFQ